jgi:uncharacterized lipoprotein YddW (UPF0748 family)
MVTILFLLENYMKTIFTLLLFLFFITPSYSQSDNYEFRSIWVVTWEYINGGSSVEANKLRIRTIFDNMKAANMTSVLLQVRQAGTAYYQSSYEPWGSYAGGSYPGFDPLEYAIEEAHKRGLELHAWFNVFASASTAPGSPAYEHPEWICRDRDGIPMTGSSIALSPGLPAVRSYLTDVAMEVVRNYDIDGLHLDYVRWNEYTNTSSLGKISDPEGPDGMISPTQLDELRMNAAGRYLYDLEHPFSAGVPSGYASWEEWWRWSVTEFVKVLQDSIKNEKAWVKLSCAALGAYNWGGWNGYDVVYQDAALWFNEGYVDQIAGMHYHWTTGSGFLNMLVYSCPQCWSQFIQPGVAAGRLYTVGPPSYILHTQNIWDNHNSIVNSSRIVDWVDGFQFFSYASWRDRNYFNEAANTFFSKKTKVRSGIPSNETVGVPQLQVTKIDSYKYKLTVTPPAVDKAYWFVIYRSETGSFSRDTTSIVEVVFSGNAFEVEEVFTGLQDYNGIYHYSVTMLNRYWKESELSNVVSTDPVPSNAPVVVLTIPAEGDTVAVTTPVEISFSKTINQNNIQNYFAFDPPVAISSVVSGPKKVVINTAGFNYNTNYTLRVDSLLRDINGRMLDGNNDGIEGDPFYLGFTTIDVDSVGPSFISIYPAAGDSIDIEDVIRLTFSEPLDTPSVNASNFILYRDNVAVLSEAVLTNYGTGAVVSIKPAQAFAQGSDYTLFISKDIADLSGNIMTSDVGLGLKARAEGYAMKRTIDNFNSGGPWEQPNFSGSTVGIMIPGTYFSYSVLVYLPSTSPQKSAELGYKWNPDVPVRLLREYLSGGTPRTVEFDTTYILQVYIHGDGSGTLFRFAIDEDMGGNNWPNHEVSKWMPIDWRGWKLVEWKLSDPSSVGSWIGNELLDGVKYRVDSFQLKDAPGSASEGVIYFDSFRASKKTFAITSVADETTAPQDFRLYQNYPNPFNPATTISFDLDRSGMVNLEIYDILGRKIKSLISGEMSAGRHSVQFDASDLSSGQYIYRIISGEKQFSRMMILMK